MFKRQNRRKGLKAIRNAITHFQRDKNRINAKIDAVINLYKELEAESMGENDPKVIDQIFERIDKATKRLGK